MDGRRVVIAGGSGFIGKAVVQEFDMAGYEVIVLSRSHKPVTGARSVEWDGAEIGPWAAELENATAVINLAGRSLFGRWTPGNFEKMERSRVQPTRILGEAIARAKRPPNVWVNGSAVGFYGQTIHPTDESAMAGQDPVAELCLRWEGATRENDLPGTRVVLLRTGLALGRDGGILQMLALATRLFLGGRLGDGRQMMAWIHIKDITRMIRWAVENDRIRGPLNGVSPIPVQNRHFMAALRRVLRRPPAPPAPAFLLRLAFKLTKFPMHLPLMSSNVVPGVAGAFGFDYEFPDLTSALRSLLR